MSHQQRIAPTVPTSPFYQGPFGRMFRALPAWVPEKQQSTDIDSFLLSIANSRMTEAPNPGPDSAIPAGYTYFGQFVDHDITFDPVSELMRENDPSGLRNHRTPRLDLDNLYGAGRDVSPYLFDQLDRGPNNKLEKLLVGEIEDSGVPDLARNSQGIALLGDLRNDENSIVAHLHLAFVLAHNRLVDEARAQKAPDAYDAARRTLRWLYQHIVWNDFLARITEDAVRSCALQLETCGTIRRWTLGLADVYHWESQPFMPVEFSVAAYRFGHSMVRNSYQTNLSHSGFGVQVPLFAPGNDPDLRGFRPLTLKNAVQWDWFLPMSTSQGPFPQLARPIDTKLSRALSQLPNEPAPNNTLAFRNLKRGFSFNLPSGTTVARSLGITPINLAQGEPDALWYYILKEAELAGGERLGTLGSIIVCATLAGLLKGDPFSYFNQRPNWRPEEEPLLTGVNNPEGTWGLTSVIRVARLRSDGVGLA